MGLARRILHRRQGRILVPYPRCRSIRPLQATPVPFSRKRSRQVHLPIEPWNTVAYGTTTASGHAAAGACRGRACGRRPFIGHVWRCGFSPASSSTTHAAASVNSLPEGVPFTNQTSRPCSSAAATPLIVRSGVAMRGRMSVCSGVSRPDTRPVSSGGRRGLRGPRRARRHPFPGRVSRRRRQTRGSSVIRRDVGDHGPSAKASRLTVASGMVRPTPHRRLRIHAVAHPGRDRAEEAWHAGATEVFIQGGIHPDPQRAAVVAARSERCGDRSSQSPARGNTAAAISPVGASRMRWADRLWCIE
jgi:hypothetical protein